MPTALVLRNCKSDLTSRNGFRWPAKGPVECPDWNPEPCCGGGLHGLLWGRDDWTLLSSAQDSIWQVIEVDTDSVVAIDSEKVKFPRGNVVFSGPMAQAVTMVLCHPVSMDGADQTSSGDYSKAASSGNYSTAKAEGGDTIAMAAGRGCTVSAGENGCFASAWYDKKQGRDRIKVGYVGRNGIKPNTPYRLTSYGEWQEVVA